MGLFDGLMDDKSTGQTGQGDDGTTPATTITEPSPVSIEPVIESLIMGKVVNPPIETEDLRNDTLIGEQIPTQEALDNVQNMNILSPETATPPSLLDVPASTGDFTPLSLDAKISAFISELEDIKSNDAMLIEEKETAIAELETKRKELEKQVRQIEADEKKIEATIASLSGKDTKTNHR